MEAIVIEKFGGPEVLEYKNVPKPTPEEGSALVHVKVFGVNHAEMHMRKGEWDEYNSIMGLECVGIVESCPGGEVQIGSKVMGVMGGMGRSIPGSYGEFVNVPVANIVPIETSLPWEELAALPEVYSTAWSCLFTVLDLQRGEKLLIRGATSTIGQAALNLAVNAGAIVTATTRQQERFDMLKELGAVDVKFEQPQLGDQFETPPRFDKTLNLIGNRVLLESISLTRPGGRMLQAGWLGGLAPVVDFNPMVEMESGELSRTTSRPGLSCLSGALSQEKCVPFPRVMLIIMLIRQLLTPCYLGVHFSLFHSKVLASPDFPLAGIPLQDIVRKLEKGEWDARPTHVFEYKDIHNAHRMLDSHKAGGKIVVKH